MPCRVRHGDSSYFGMVLDISRTGLFVQTSASASRGANLELQLDLVGEAGPVPVAAQVVWQRRVAPQLRQVAEGGLGLRIHNAPEPFYRMLAKLAKVAEPESVAAPASIQNSEALPKFKVLLKRDGAPRTRTVEMSAQGPEEARTRAVKSIGAGWSVLNVNEA